MDPAQAASEAETTTDLLTAAASGRCTNCNAQLASDQRYCISCGERRGKPRFALHGQAPAATASAPAKRERRPRVSAGTTLVAGVATLLLAMGVGVLIGQNSTNNSPQPVASQKPITVNVSGGGGGGTAASGSTTVASTRSGSKSRHGAKTATKAAHLSTKTTTKVNQAASNVVGSQAKLAPPTTQVGGSCTNGEAGCQNNHFTGGFFGGG